MYLLLSSSPLEPFQQPSTRSCHLMSMPHCALCSPYRIWKRTGDVLNCLNMSQPSQPVDVDDSPTIHQQFTTTWDVSQLKLQLPWNASGAKPYHVPEPRSAGQPWSWETWADQSAKCRLLLKLVGELLVNVGECWVVCYWNKYDIRNNKGKCLLFVMADSTMVLLFLATPSQVHDRTRQVPIGAQ